MKVFKAFIKPFQAPQRSENKYLRASAAKNQKYAEKVGSWGS